MKTMTLKVPQARVLKALLKAGGSGLTRGQLSVAAGFSAISGTVNRALHGIKRSAPQAEYANPHPGLLKLGFVTAHTLDVDIPEVRYRVSQSGKKALAAFLSERKLGKTRDKSVCVNHRYMSGNGRR